MSIKILTEDALSLRDQGKHLSALTLLLAAVAASSRKCFDHPDQVTGRPGGIKRDADAFKSFLGGRFRSRHSAPGIHADDYGSSGIVITFKGKQSFIEDILYKHYRNGLLHEGRLPECVGFKEWPSDFSIEVSNEYISFSYGLIDVLADAVVYARCNGSEFGISHFRLVRRDNIDFPNLLSEMEKLWPRSSSRVPIFEAMFFIFDPESVATASDDDIQSLLSSAINKDQINGGMMTTLYFRGLATDDHHLTDCGLEALRYLAPAYEILDDSF